MQSGKLGRMPGLPSFAVQVFERRASGVVVGCRLEAASQSEALEKAAEVADLFGGAAALVLTHDDGGRLWSATVLRTIGETAAGWTDGLAGA